MTGKTGKKELLTILLAGLCLNVSSLHLHTLNAYSATAHEDALHLTNEKLPFCFACKHLSYGLISAMETQKASLPCRESQQFQSDESLSDFSPYLLANKSPPS